MFGLDPTCVSCGNGIKGEEVTYIKLRYPKRKGMAEVKAWLANEGVFTCESCYNKNHN